jgi:NAD(P)-dependent dehydrogenase (short-subunit alcohol dehydrogenase family)
MTMSGSDTERRSAIVFGARNLGRAVIEALLAEGWAVAVGAQSQSTLDLVGEAGALALKADITDPASVRAALEEAAAAHDGIDLAVNAAAAYGGDRSGPFGGGAIVDAELGAFDAWAAPPRGLRSRSYQQAADSHSRKDGRQRLSRSRAGRHAAPWRAAVCGRLAHSACGQSLTRPRSSSAPTVSRSRS